MPRQGRLHVPHAYYHVLGRGLERRNIFENDIDKKDFLGRMANALQKSSTICVAWALMSNHYHFLFRAGAKPLSGLMAGVLGGYATRYNRRYRRSGYVFQNRFTSILCDAEAYFLALLRYIHLNPVRAGMVQNVDSLDTYPWTGHATVMGRRECAWVSSKEVLSRFGSNQQAAKRHYRAFILAGLSMDDPLDLDGGGLIRSAGGWETATKTSRSVAQRMGDERILGGSDFVESVLRDDSIKLSTSSKLAEAGVDLATLSESVCKYLGIDISHIKRRGRNSARSKARALICYFGTIELGLSQRELATVLMLSQPGVSVASERGRALCEKENLDLEIVLRALK